MGVDVGIKGAEFCEREGLFVITGVTGIDPSTGTLASSPEEQFKRAFANLGEIAGAMGVSAGDIGRVTVLTPDQEFRSLINDPWLVLFPDETDRPARKTTQIALGPEVQVELEAVGVRGATRQPLEIEGVKHRDPIPMGCRVGDYVFSSVIIPDDPRGGRPEGVEQIKQCYTNMGSLMEAGGGSLADVANVWVYSGAGMNDADLIDVWLAEFPEEGNRPTRKTFDYPPRAGIQLQCEAVLHSSKVNIEISGKAHHDPIPMGAITGRLFTSSGMNGADLTNGTMPDGITEQSRNALESIQRLLDDSGVKMDQLFHLTTLVGDQKYIPGFEEVWHEMYPDAAGRPAVQYMELGLAGRASIVQVIVKGALPA